MFTLTLPHPPVPTLTPLSRSHEYLTTPTGKSPAAVRQNSHPSCFDWNQSQWLNMDGILHELLPTMFDGVLPPPEQSPDLFLPPLEVSWTVQLEESRKRAASSATIDILEVSF